MFIRLQAHKNASVRGGGHPSPTIAFGHDAASARWFPSMESVLMWGYTTRPAPRVTSGGGKASGIEIFDQQSRKRMIEQIKEGTKMSEKVMICGNCEFGNHDVDTCEAASASGIVPMREKHWRNNEALALEGIAEMNAADLASVAMTGNNRPINPKTPLDPIRVTVGEVAMLQSVPRDFIWDAEYEHTNPKTGKKTMKPVANTKKYLIIGNAEPPLLAQRVLEALWAVPADNVIAFPVAADLKAAA